MTRGIISTSKPIKDSGVDVVGVAAVHVFVTLHWVDSSCLFSDTTLEWILGMVTVYVAVVKGLDSSGLFSLFFGNLNFKISLFWLLDVPFATIASVNRFAFKKKATKCEWLLLHEGSGIQRVVFMWGRSWWVGQFPISIKHTFWTTFWTYFQHAVSVSKQRIYMYKVKQ